MATFITSKSVGQTIKIYVQTSTGYWKYNHNSSDSSVFADGVIDNIEILNANGEFTLISCLSDGTPSGNITSLGLSGVRNSPNQITSFDGTGLTSLTNLDLNDNQLTSFDGTGLTSLTSLHLQTNQLTSFSNLPSSLISLNLSNNQLTSFNGTGLTSLTTLYLNNNQLTSLSNLPSSLNNLYLYNNLLTSFSNLPSSLNSLNLGNNQLTSFNGTGLTSLTSLVLVNNLLTSIDVSPMVALTSLFLADVYGLNGNPMTATANNAVLAALVANGAGPGNFATSGGRTSAGTADYDALNADGWKLHGLELVGETTTTTTEAPTTTTTTEAPTTTTTTAAPAGVTFNSVTLAGTRAVTSKGKTEYYRHTLITFNNDSNLGHNPLQGNVSMATTTPLTNGSQIVINGVTYYFISISNISPLQGGNSYFRVDFIPRTGVYTELINFTGSEEIKFIYNDPIDPTYYDINEESYTWNDVKYVAPATTTTTTASFPPPSGPATFITSKSVGQTILIKQQTSTGYWKHYHNGTYSSVFSNNQTVTVANANGEFTIISCLADGTPSGNITFLGLDENQLTSFNGTGLTSLTTLNLQSNQLTSFDGTDLTSLNSLVLVNNLLTSIDVSPMVALTNLFLADVYGLNGNPMTATANNAVLAALVANGAGPGNFATSGGRTSAGTVDYDALNADGWKLYGLELITPPSGNGKLRVRGISQQ